MRSWMLASLVTAAFLAGCLDDGPDPAGEPLGEESDAVERDLTARQSTAGSGDAAAHGEPQIEWEPVETGRDGLQLLAYAVQRGTITNDFAGASVSDVTLAVGSGDVTVLPSPDGDYHYEIEIVARGLTEDLAAQDLAEWEVEHEDGLHADGTLVLATRIRHEDDPIVPGVHVSFGGASASMTVYLPDGPAHTVRAGSGSGDVAVRGLPAAALALATGSGDVLIEQASALELTAETGSGSIQADEVRAARFSASASSGDVDVRGLEADHAVFGTGSGDIDVHAVRAGSLQAATSSGDIRVEDATVGVLSADTGSGDLGLEGTFADVSASASSGSISANLLPLRSGTWSFGTGSGDIDVTVMQITADHGFDVVADTGSGSVHVELPGTTIEDMGPDEEHIHVRTVGFEDRPVQVRIQAGASSGDIAVTG